MKRFWIVVLIIAISLSACSKKIEKIPEQDVIGEAATEEFGNEEQLAEKEDSVAEKEKPEETNDTEEQPTVNDREDDSPTMAQKPEEGRFKIPDFKTVDLHGNEVTSDFFTKNKVTVLNIWTTT